MKSGNGILDVFLKIVDITASEGLCHPLGLEITWERGWQCNMEAHPLTSHACYSLILVFVNSLCSYVIIICVLIDFSHNCGHCKVLLVHVVTTYLESWKWQVMGNSVTLVSGNLKKSGLSHGLVEEHLVGEDTLCTLKARLMLSTCVTRNV